MNISDSKEVGGVMNPGVSSVVNLSESSLGYVKTLGKMKPPFTYSKLTPICSKIQKENKLNILSFLIYRNKDIAIRNI